MIIHNLAQHQNNGTTINHQTAAIRVFSIPVTKGNPSKRRSPTITLNKSNTIVQPIRGPDAAAATIPRAGKVDSFPSKIQ